MEARVAVLEEIAASTKVAQATARRMRQLRSDMISEMRQLRTDMQQEFRSLRGEHRADFRWLLGIMLGGFAGPPRA